MNSNHDFLENEQKYDFSSIFCSELAKEKNKRVDVKKITKAYNYAKAKHRRSKAKIR